MTAVSSEVLLQATEDRIRRLTLNRPTSRNALSAELRERFFGALRAAEADDEVDIISSPVRASHSVPGLV